MTTPKTDIETDVRVLSVILGAFLTKHKIICAAAIDDPEGFDGYETLRAIKAVAKDLVEWNKES